jgi:hypothetical protein
LAEAPHKAIVTGLARCVKTEQLAQQRAAAHVLITVVLVVGNTAMALALSHETEKRRYHDVGKKLCRRDC